MNSKCSYVFEHHLLSMGLTGGSFTTTDQNERALLPTFYNAFGIHLKFLNFLQLSSNGRGLGCLSPGGQGSPDCTAMPLLRRKSGSAPLLLKGKGHRKCSYTQLFLRHTHRRKDSVMILQEFLPASRKGHTHLSPAVIKSLPVRQG